jgi:hypothetical protein
MRTVDVNQIPLCLVPKSDQVQQPPEFNQFSMMEATP